MGKRVNIRLAPTVLLALLATLVGPASAAVGAEGFGSQTAGGNGQPVVRVVEPTDAAVRAAFNAAVKGNRQIVFDTTRPIELKDPLPRITGPNVTIEGNGATLVGVGIGCSAALVDVRGHDAIVRNLHVRNGGDNLRVQGPAYNVLVSHVSSTGACDDGIGIGYGAHDVTVEWSFFSGNTRSIFLKYQDPYNISLHHNWIRIQWIRGPLATDVQNLDMRNNVVEDWNMWGARLESASSGNVINNVFGLGSHAKSLGGKTNALRVVGDSRAFVSGNAFQGAAVETDESKGSLTQPLIAPPVTTHSVAEAESLVRARAGVLPRDGWDHAYVGVQGWAKLGDTTPLRLSGGGIVPPPPPPVDPPVDPPPPPPVDPPPPPVDPPVDPPPPPPVDPPPPPADPGDPNACNVHMRNSLSFPIPGRGLALSWAPAGSAVAAGNAIAVGGHLIGRQTYKAGGERYDTKIFNTSTGAYIKRFGAHYWWSVSNVWEMNPYLGELLAQGAGDHAAKLFNAAGRGTPSSNGVQDANMRGRFAVDDGALAGVKAAYGNNTPGLPNINGWITALAISPDGRYLASANRDRMVRIWQLADDVYPDEQFRVIKVFYAHGAGNLTSIRWAPDGKSFAVGHKQGDKGEAAIFSWNPARDRWPSHVVREFSGGTTTTTAKGKTTVKVTKGVAYASQPGWLAARPQLHAEDPIWRTSGLGNVWNVRYSPDGRYLAVTSSKASAVYDLSSNKAYALHSKAHGLDFSPDGRSLALGGADKRVYIYDPQSDPPFKRHDTLIGHKESVVGAVAWSRDGQTLATTAGGPLLGNSEFNNSVQGKDDTVRLWTAADGGNAVRCSG